MTPMATTQTKTNLCWLVAHCRSFNVESISSITHQVPVARAAAKLFEAGLKHALLADCSLTVRTYAVDEIILVGIASFETTAICAYCKANVDSVLPKPNSIASHPV